MVDEIDPTRSPAAPHSDSRRLPWPVQRVLVPGADELMLERVARRLALRPRRSAVRRSRARVLAVAVVTASLGAFAFHQLGLRLAFLDLFSSPGSAWEAGSLVSESPAVCSVETSPAILVNVGAMAAETSSASVGVGPGTPEVSTWRRLVVPAPPLQGGLEPTPQPDWRSLAEREAFADAFAALGAQGLLWESQRAASVAELFMLADVARRSGHAALAVAPLEQVLERFGGHADASLAAFTLGKLQFDTLNDAPRAVEAFERALKLELPPSLRRHAYARLIEALTRTGDHERARALAADSERLFPQARTLRSAP